MLGEPIQRRFASFWKEQKIHNFQKGQNQCKGSTQIKTESEFTYAKSINILRKYLAMSEPQNSSLRMTTQDICFWKHWHVSFKRKHLNINLFLRRQMNMIFWKRWNKFFYKTCLGRMSSWTATGQVIAFGVWLVKPIWQVPGPKLLCFVLNYATVTWIWQTNRVGQ